MRKYVALLMVAALIVIAAAGCGTGKGGAKEDPAKDFPKKPIELLNASSAGSPADVMARELAKYAEKYLGQPVVVVNKTGGSGGVQMAALKAAQPDGYTIGATTAAITGTLNTELKDQFVLDDFEFIIRVQVDPFVLVVRNESPFKTLDDLIKYAEENPGKLKIGGNGTGSGQHLTVLRLAKAAGIEVTWVPFEGGSQAITAGLGGHVDAVSTAPAAIYSHVEAGKLRPLALSSEQRLASLPDTPTMKELGYDVVAMQWRGIFARKGIPKEIIQKLHDAFKKAMEDPGFVEYMKNTKQENGYLGPAEFTAAVKKEFEETGKILEGLKLK